MCRQRITFFASCQWSPIFLTVRANVKQGIHGFTLALQHTLQTELILWSITCGLSARGTTFICTLYIYISRNQHRNHPRLVLIWPRITDDKATNDHIRRSWVRDSHPGGEGGGGVVGYSPIYVSMCHPKGYGFWAVWVWKRVFDHYGLNRVWFSREPRERINEFVFSDSKLIIEKEKYPKYIIFTNSWLCYWCEA